MKWGGVTLTGRPARLLLILAALAIAFLVATVSSPLAARPAARYVLVIDCGSSGSRITAFRISASHDSALPNLTPLSPTAAAVPSAQPTEGLLTERVQTMPGIAEAFQADTRWGVRQSLRPLLQWAEAAIPAEEHAKTALLICATAGVRAQPVAKQALILQKARNFALGSRFLFKAPWAVVLPAPWEAALGWLALNHRYRLLPGSTSGPPHKQVITLPETDTNAAGQRALQGGARRRVLPDFSVDPETVALLDVGGSSVELAAQGDQQSAGRARAGRLFVEGGVGFDAEASEPLSRREKAVTFRIAGRSIVVKTAAQQHVGMNDAWARTVTLSMTDAGVPVPQPAGPGNGGRHSMQRRTQGSEASQRQRRRVQADGASNVSDAVTEIKHGCLPAGYSQEVEGYGGEEQLVLVGPSPRLPGQAEADCRDIVARLFRDADATCPQTHACDIHPMSGLAPANIVGLSGLHVVYAHFQLPPGNASAADLPAAITAECNRDLPALHALYGAEQHLHLYCFRGLLVLQLLSALGVDESRLLVDDGLTAWSAGAALYWAADLARAASWLPGWVPAAPKALRNVIPILLIAVAAFALAIFFVSRPFPSAADPATALPPRAPPIRRARGSAPSLADPGLATLADTSRALLSKVMPGPGRRGAGMQSQQVSPRATQPFRLPRGSFSHKRNASRAHLNPDQ